MVEGRDTGTSSSGMHRLSSTVWYKKEKNDRKITALIA